MSGLTVAAINFEPVYGDLATNLARMDEWLCKLSQTGAELVVFPEMSLTGYRSDEKACRQAQAVPGEAVRQLAAMAKKYRIALTAGLVELDEHNAAYYVSQLLVTPQGLAGVYRKTHLSRNEKRVFGAGAEAGVYHWRDVTIGIQLCYDSHFPELSTCQALAGAQLLCMCFATPMGSPQELLERWKRYLPARAYDNTCCLIACNQAGRSPTGSRFAGCALAVDARGKVLGETAGWQESVLAVSFSEDDLHAAEMKRFLSHRQPGVYCLDSRTTNEEQVNVQAS